MSDYVEAGKILEFLDAETNALNSTPSKRPRLRRLAANTMHRVR